MIRLFEQHRVREQKELEGYWDFEALDTCELPKVYTEKMYVPSCWESDVKYSDYRGYAAYKKRIFISEPGYYRWNFKGVSHSGKVYLDGIFLGEHYNAFTGFEIEAEILEIGEHCIEVLVDNTFSQASTLHKPNDYYTYGGITKPVVMEKLPSVYIGDMKFISELIEEQWIAVVQVKLMNRAKSPQKIEVIVELEGQTKALYAGLVEVLAEDTTTINLREICEGVEPWSEKTPNLSMLSVTITNCDSNKVIDDLIDRVGFRIIEVVGTDILLNKKKIFIQGYNRHEEFNILGCAIPTQAMAVDMAMMRDLGSNSVRTCHYPNDERFLDMCDELGIFVWEESHARGLDLEQMQLPNFDKQSKDCIDEMIGQHKNHACILMWGILNECSSNTIEGKAIHEKQLKQIKELDPTRPTTYASNKHGSDISFDLVDIMSTNIYLGWYHEYDTQEAIDAAFEAHYQWMSGVCPGKPIIISEFGAGAVYGYRPVYKVKWSEERQSEILEQTLKTFQNHPAVSGTFIWQFSDVRVTEEGWAMKRPKNINNKGTVDEFRRPKMAYKTVKSIFHKKLKEL